MRSFRCIFVTSCVDVSVVTSDKASSRFFFFFLSRWFFLSVTSLDGKSENSLRWKTLRLSSLRIFPLLNISTINSHVFLLRLVGTIVASIKKCSQLFAPCKSQFSIRRKKHTTEEEKRRFQNANIGEVFLCVVFECFCFPFLFGISLIRVCERIRLSNWIFLARSARCCFLRIEKVQSRFVFFRNRQSEFKPDSHTRSCFKPFR